jgi:hypothetical protein
MTNSEIWMIALTAVVAVGGIIAACIFNNQLAVMRGQLDVAEKTLVTVQRAFVAPTVQLTPLRNSANKLEYWRVHIALENNGSTQTHKLRWTFTGGVDLSPDPEANTIPVLYNTDNNTNGTGFLAPKGKMIIIDSLINRTKMAEIIKGRGVYYLGRADYDDIFEKPHITKFCVHLYGALGKQDCPIACWRRSLMDLILAITCVVAITALTMNAQNTTLGQHRLPNSTMSR